MTHVLPKFLACAILAILSSVLYLFLRGRHDEELWLRRLVILTFGGTVLGAIAVYIFVPDAVRFSDPILFYYPETQSLLSGQLPYRDFATSYAPFFHPLLVPGLLLWDSPGAIVALMLASEAALIWAYIWLCGRQNRSLTGWRTAWFIVSSPIMVYWIALGGYNSVLIATFSMFGLVLAAVGRPSWAGSLGALGLLCCKILGVLSWPSIILADRIGAGRRAVPMIVAVIVLFSLIVFDIDPMAAVRRESRAWTDGNVWAILVSVVPTTFRAEIVNWLSPAAFAIAVGIGTLRYARGSFSTAQTRFDATVAHLSWVMIAFILLSKKSQNPYLTMLVPFLAHTLVVYADRGRALLGLVPWIALGMFTTTFAKSSWIASFAADPFAGGLSDAFFLGLTVIKVIALSATAWACWLMMAPPRTYTDTVPSEIPR